MFSNGNCAAELNHFQHPLETQSQICLTPQDASTFCSSIKTPKIPLVYVVVICVHGLLSPKHSAYHTDI